MMNIDKFGHHVHKRFRFAQNYNETLQKSENGDFDLRSSRLKGLKAPLSNDEAVNKEYVDRINKIIQTNLANIILSLKRVNSILEEIDKKFCTQEDVIRIIKEESK